MGRMSLVVNTCHGTVMQWLLWSTVYADFLSEKEGITILFMQTTQPGSSFT